MNVSAKPWNTIPTTIINATGCIPRISPDIKLREAINRHYQHSHRHAKQRSPFSQKVGNKLNSKKYYQGINIGVPRR